MQFQFPLAVAHHTQLVFAAVQCHRHSSGSVRLDTQGSGPTDQDLPVQFPTLGIPVLLTDRVSSDSRMQIELAAVHQ